MLETIIPALAGGTVSGINMAQQQKMNKQSMKFHKDMYWMQRQDALNDWHRQNFYNSPAEMKKRLEAAGLNTNLIYGKGAENTAGMVRSSQGSAPNMTAPRFDGATVTNSLLTHANLKAIQAQTDNLQASAIKSLAEAAKTKRQQFEMEGLYDLKIDQMKSQLRVQEYDIEQKKANTIYILDKNEREKLMNTTDIELKTQQMLHEIEKKATTMVDRTRLRVAIDNARKEGRILEYKAALADENINPNDPMWARLMVELLAETPSNKKSFIKGRLSDLKDYFKGNKVSGAGGSW